MNKATENPKRLTADQIADRADKGEDISRFFTNAGKMMPSIHASNAKLGLLPPKDRHVDEI